MEIGVIVVIAWPGDLLSGIDGVPGDREVVELLMVYLHLLAVEGQQDRGIGEPLVGVAVPNQPTANEAAPDQRLEPPAMGEGDCRAAIEPVWLISLDTEVEHSPIIHGDQLPHRDQAERYGRQLVAEWIPMNVAAR